MEDNIRSQELPIYVEDEIKASYLDYSMSVIVSRALPDVRDGLKPVHRRILFAMNELGMTSDKPHKKSARIVGEVLGKYHPHGDTAVYYAMVRLAQEFNTRYQLIDGHGNFGSIDGDSAAAMRYTEARMEKITEQLLEDISKNTIDFRKNFDESLDEPVVLPAKLPNLLLNGATGIAVGMATNMPPHNITEVCDGIVALIDNRDISVDELIKYIPGPDFPTGAIISGKSGIYDAYKTGRGKIKVIAKADIETNKQGKSSIVVTQIPYQVNKAKLIEKIAEQVKLKKITGITDLRDESNREGIRIVIEVKKGEQPEIILNHLYKYTDMQITYGIINLALVNNVPKVLNLKQILENYLKHRFEVVERRTKFELDKAKKRAHILEGFRIALDSIDEIISLIRSSNDPNIARERLMSEFGFTEVQAKAILDMKLQRLTGLERDKIEQEYAELISLIERLNEILASDDKKYEIIKEEVIELKTKFGDKRRTEITNEITDIDVEDLIKQEEVVVTITNKGYVKRVPAELYKTQKRGGIGVSSTSTVEDDQVKDIYTANSLDSLVVFTDKGKSYKIKVYEIPEMSKQARGKLINNIINIAPDEKVTTILQIGDKKEDLEKEVFLLTKKGIAKKTKVELFKNINKAGLKAIKLNEDDSIVFVTVCSGKNDQIFIATKNGYAIRVSEKDFRSMGRTASGVRAIKLRQGDEVVSASLISENSDEENLYVLTITESGYGKKTKLSEYGLQGRAGKGLKNIKITDKTKNVISTMVVSKDDKIIMLISQSGTLIKTSLESISIFGRATSGVRVMKLREDDLVQSVALSNEGEDNE